MTSNTNSNKPALLAAGIVGAAATLGGRKLVDRVIRGRFSDTEDYNIAKIKISGPIQRTHSRPSSLSGRDTATADDIVELIEAAADDEHAEALLLELNTPGGEVVPSDDIRRAAVEFDGPTIAYVTDTCASGGYWIASGCDELWARDISLVGSIGVVGSRPNAAGLADTLGISYEQFVETVSEGRDMDPDEIRETEARIYLGAEAAAIGLVDELVVEADVEDRIGELIDADPQSREFEPDRSFAERLGIGAERVAFAGGNGIASVVAGDGSDLDVKLK